MYWEGGRGEGGGRGGGGGGEGGRGREGGREGGADMTVCNNMMQHSSTNLSAWGGESAWVKVYVHVLYDTGDME